jgi:tetraprenyl-beta-curcumene synthase
MARVRELAALLVIMMRFWCRVLPRARAHLRDWERIAATMPDPVLRAHALETLRSEGFSALGAALVATTIDAHDPALVRLLMALQVAWDYIDTLAEQPAADRVANGVQLHRALLDAISCAPPRDDYYRLVGNPDDGGYLATLVADCQTACTQLPAFDAVRAVALAELETAEVQYVNHAAADVRAPALQRWAAQTATRGDASWSELAAAASSSLGVLALLATAADPATTEWTVAQIHSAYVPWIDALTALLDSLVDRRDDAATGLMNWMAQYPSDAVAATRLREITARAIDAARALPRGERHVVIVVGMIAMHLSQPSAWLPETVPATRAVLRATGSFVTPLLLALLRVWRMLLTRRQPTPVFNSE